MGVVAEQVESASVDANGYIGRIPVRNLWLLMLYASELFRTRGIGKVGLEDNPDDLPDLVAEILAHAVEVRQRRRLNLGYRSRDAVLNRVRGRIDVLNTERHRLLDRGLVACRFDELTVDTPRNRFVRAALETIARIVQRKDVSHRCRSLASGMKAMGVSGDVPTRAQMSTDRFGRNDADDRFMVAAAKLAFDLALPTEVAGTNVLTRRNRFCPLALRGARGLPSAWSPGGPQRRLDLSPCHQTWQDLSATIDPSAELAGCPPPASPSPQRRRLQPPCAKVEGEVHDGRKSPFGLGGQHRAVAQRCGERRLQVARQIDLGFGLRDRRVRRLAQMAVANRPVARWADVRMRASRIGLRHAVEPLEALGQLDGRFRHPGHERTRSNTRPRNQKFSTPAHSA